MFDSLSASITNSLKKHLVDMDKEREEIINYGLNIIIYQISVFAFIFALAFILNIVTGILTTIAVYGLLRICAGGAHAKTRIECFIITNGLLFGTVYLSKFIRWDTYFPSFVIFAMGLVFIHLYAPGDTTEKPILSERIKRYQKTLSYMAITLVTVLSMIIYNQDKVIYNIIIISLIPFLFQLTPIGYKLLRCKHSYEEVPVQ